MLKSFINNFFVKTKTSENILNYEGLSFSKLIKLKKTKRKKSISIRVVNNNVLINAPYFVRDDYIIDLLIKKKDWIEKRILENSNSIGKVNSLKNGDSIFYLGNKYTINIKKCSNNNVIISNDKLIVTYFKNKKYKNTLEDWYKDKCKHLIESKLIFFSKKIGVKFHNYTLRSYKLRLGSCSNKSNLSFNWKLIMMPEEIIDYVIIHELCHIIHFNHSKSFWNEVAKHCPDFKLRKKWIRKNMGLLVW